ncbi:MAG: TonB-dependent receptor [Pseudomonadota bacterium]
MPLCSAMLLGLSSQAIAQGAAGDSEDAEARQETVIVTGRAQALYRAGESTTGKLAADPLDSTQVITTINADLIRDQGARDAQDIYRNIAGVSLFSYAGVTARGFRQEEIFFDGLRGDPYVGFNVPQLFNVERVDFLKGPAGMLYGQGAPGGLFNYVTKKPEAEFSANIRGIIGTEERYGGSAEITGALPLDGTAGRLGVFFEDRETPRVNTASRVAIYDAGISFDLGIADLILQATRYEQDLDGNRLRGVPVDDDGNFLTDRRWNHNEETDFLDLESTNFQGILRGEIGTQFDWDATLRYTDASQEQEYHEPRALIDIEGLLGLPTDGSIDLVGREFRDQLREEEQLSFGANVTWNGSFGNIDNRLLIGTEYFEEEFTGIFFTTRLSPDFITRFLQGASLPSDIIPLFLDGSNYGVTQPLNYDRGAPRDASSDTELFGVYALNEATIGPFTLVGGLRYDDNSNDEDTNTSFRVGGIYKPQENVSLFVQFADSYTPQSAGSQDPEVGGPFNPVTGTILEGGVKAELFDGRFFTSVSVYDIVRENILQNTGEISASGRDILAPLGEVTSTGAEVEIFADITPNWVFTAAYAYNDARITEVLNTGGNRGFSNSVGDRFANAPEHQFGFWTRYQVPAINTAFAFGGDYVDDRLSLSGQTVQDYLIFDASIIYEAETFDLLLRIENLFDEEYAESGFLSRTGHFPGDPTSVFLEATRRF